MNRRHTALTLTLIAALFAGLAPSVAGASFHLVTSKGRTRLVGSQGKAKVTIYRVLRPVSLFKSQKVFRRPRIEGTPWRRLLDDALRRPKRGNAHFRVVAKSRIEFSHGAPGLIKLRKHGPGVYLVEIMDIAKNAGADRFVIATSQQN